MSQRPAMGKMWQKCNKYNHFPSQCKKKKFNELEENSEKLFLGSKIQLILVIKNEM